MATSIAASSPRSSEAALPVAAGAASTVGAAVAPVLASLAHSTVAGAQTQVSQNRETPTPELDPFRSPTRRLPLLMSDLVFFPESSILRKHPVKTLPTPCPSYVESNNADLQDLIANKATCPPKLYEKLVPGFQEAAEKANTMLAITREGKHLLLQQAARSCVPTAIAMLALDAGKNIDFSEVFVDRGRTDDEKIDLIKAAGLTPLVVDHCGESEEERMKFLQSRIEEYGPALLVVVDRLVGGHTIILDKVSIEEGRATIRDPLHGWMIDVELSSLSKMIAIHNPIVQISRT